MASFWTWLWRVAVLLILLRIWWGVDPRMPFWAWTGVAVAGVAALGTALFRSYQPDLERRREAREAADPDELSPALRFESQRRGQR